MHTHAYATNLKKNHSTQQDVENKSRLKSERFHVNVWQKPTQYCKVIILKLKILKIKRYCEQIEKKNQTWLTICLFSKYVSEDMPLRSLLFKLLYNEDLEKHFC